MQCSAIVVVFLSAALCMTGVSSADVAASDLSCNFGRDYCSWTNDTSVNGAFLREFNSTNYRLVPTNCYFLLASAASGDSGSSKLDSPNFVIKESTAVLQLNFSYWLKNSRATQLKLFLVPLEGMKNGTEMLVWETRQDQKSTELWNATNVNFKDVAMAKRYRLSLQGLVNPIDDVAAVERIVVTELTAAQVPSLDKLPAVTYQLEKAEENPNLCSSASSLVGSLFSLSAFALLYVFHKSF